jgi:hypothetical protein
LAREKLQASNPKLQRMSRLQVPVGCESERALCAVIPPDVLVPQGAVRERVFVRGLLLTGFRVLSRVLPTRAAIKVATGGLQSWLKVTV